VVLPDGRCGVLFQARGYVMRTRITERAADIRAWEPEQTLALNTRRVETRASQRGVLPNPVMRADGTLLLFWRGTNGRPASPCRPRWGHLRVGRIVFQARRPTPIPPVLKVRAAMAR
jgi:hypothetical protein